MPSSSHAEIKMASKSADDCLHTATVLTEEHGIVMSTVCYSLEESSGRHTRSGSSGNAGGGGDDSVYVPVDVSSPLL